MKRVVAFLESKGFDVWVDNKGLIPGTSDWERAIEEAIISCGAVVSLMSPDSSASIWVRRELDFSDKYKKKIFPLLVGGNEKTSTTLRMTTHQFVDIRKKEDEEEE